ncbi:MAG: hypothetical protein SXA11_04345 [Cyanobacteriota bacterium]|nr:hypothetical protein [Cyanobacteriota bacterium]
MLWIEMERSLERYALQGLLGMNLSLLHPGNYCEVWGKAFGF